ncbi:MAG: 2Fe-2S iron-sulfur cluster-binding protein, partial [Gemmataceae bacterium]|nr:2Fe-2S iron-sulfur cluster-binding protein [Gemmataceae bacterium]
MTDAAETTSTGSTDAAAPPLVFTFAGRTITARAGQSVAAALYAAGQRIFSRSFKYHRPRGLFCASGDCPNCLMQVDGRPNVRTCMEPVRSGMVVAPQNAWPSLGFDLLRLFDYLSWFLPVGFYYRRFHKPRWAWPWFERLLRRLAGLGTIDVQARPANESAVVHLQAQVCVVGGGPSGITAALEHAQRGAEVLLLERSPRLGGHWLFDRPAGPDPLPELLAHLRASSRIRVETGAQAFGLYEGRLLGAIQADRLLKVRAGQFVLATGARQRPLEFANNDLPGIMLSDAVLRLGFGDGVRAGRRAVVLTNHDEGWRHVPERLHELGIEVVAVVDVRRAPVAAPIGTIWPIWPGYAVLRALGTRRVRAVEIARRGPDGRTDPGSAQTISCDLVCLATERHPAHELALQAGARYAYQAGVWQMEQDVPEVICVGRAAHRAAPRPDGSEPDLRQIRGGKRFVCLCEDVTVKDLAQAVAEGFDHVETLKRYTTIGMGPCQGKMCGLQGVEECANLTGRTKEPLAVTTARPPLVPVELAVLAAETRHQPVRRTPLHHWHAAAGAKWLAAGQWQRPETYGDAAAEVRNVRQHAGLIDVSTLGKIELVGPDAVPLL